jgi:tetratricopeptide (TPR) repeat protein
VSEEIFRLRKQGDLNAALELARKRRREDPRDIWIARAYGWVLYDLAKQSLAQTQSTGEVDAAQAAFRQVAQEFEPLRNAVAGDLCGQRFAVLEEQFRSKGGAPIMALRKAKNHSAAMMLAKKLRAESPNDPGVAQAYAWVLYDEAKQVAEVALASSNSAPRLTKEFTPVLGEFARVAAPFRGTLLFSVMMKLVVRVAREWPAFLRFAHWAGSAALRPEDRLSERGADGKPYDSLEKRLRREICRAAGNTTSATPDVRPEVLTWAREILATALQKEPDDPWLNYYQCKVLVAEGRMDDALKSLMPVIGRQPKAPWAWNVLATILQGSHPDDAIICLARATEVKHDEQEVVRIRVELAGMLQARGEYDDAAFHARVASEYRKAQEWKQTPALEAMLDCAWYRERAGTALKQPASVRAAADAILAQHEHLILVQSRGVVDHINGTKALTFIATSSDTGHALHHDRFEDASRLAPGTVVDLWLLGKSGPVRRFAVSSSTTHPGLVSEYSGTVERQAHQPFAFVEAGVGRVFLSPPFASALEPGLVYDVRVLAVRSKDKRGKDGWKVVRVLSRSEGREVVAAEYEEDEDSSEW